MCDMADLREAGWDLALLVLGQDGGNDVVVRPVLVVQRQVVRHDRDELLLCEFLQDGRVGQGFMAVICSGCSVWDVS